MGNMKDIKQIAILLNLLLSLTEKGNWSVVYVNA